LRRFLYSLVSVARERRWRGAKALQEFGAWFFLTWARPNGLLRL
jgi:hypothetical protein